MRFITLISIVATSALVAAQSLPSCVTPCYTSNIPASGCAQTDLACLCASQKFEGLVAQCLQTTCTSQSDLDAAIAFGVQSCAQSGITITAASLTLEPSGATSSGASSTSSVPVTSSTASAATSTVTSASASSSSSATGKSSTATVISSTSSAPAATTSTTKSAASKVSMQIGALGCVFVAVIALL